MASSLGRTAWTCALPADNDLQSAEGHARRRQEQVRIAMQEDENRDVVLAVDGPVAMISFNRPQRRNALTMAMLNGFRRLLDQVAASDARVLILRGEGKDFCVGADVHSDPDAAPRPSYEELASIYESGGLLHEMPQITIAAIDGGCAGPGMAWAAACDFRFASDRAVFNTAFLNVGVAGEMGLAWSLLRLVGGSWARELLLFPAKFDSEEARRLGLVTRVFAADDLLAQARSAAAQLAARAPAALKVAKANILSGEKLSLADFIAIEGARHAHIAFSEARTEGFKAFAEGRAPAFPKG
jgi:2-(1,2-epoxy-1,2-dihydrophenyl)acetyl-CoA isomerase